TLTSCTHQAWPSWLGWPLKRTWVVPAGTGVQKLAKWSGWLLGPCARGDWYDLPPSRLNRTLPIEAKRRKAFAGAAWGRDRTVLWPSWRLVGCTGRSITKGVALDMDTSDQWNVFGRPAEPSGFSPFSG